MAVPKRKKSKSKKRMRKRSLSGEILSARPCPQCGAPVQSHRACPSCGTYKGRQVVSVTADE